jgi:hypothetical protein
MTPRIAHKIASLVSAGAVVVGPKPLKSPSFNDTGGGDAEVARVGDALWGTADGKKVWMHRYRTGRVYLGRDLTQIFSDLHCAPDVQARGLNWIHRLDGNTDVYFVANPRYAPDSFDVTFRVAGKQPELWDPMTGESHPADVWNSGKGRTTVTLRLESAGSTFVVFRAKPHGDHAISITRMSGSKPVVLRPKIQIISARYEANDGAGGVDVTGKVQAMVAAGETEVPATNAAYGDPAYNHLKHLHLVYRVGATKFEKDVAENDSLQLVGPGSDSTPPDFIVENGVFQSWNGSSYLVRMASGRTRTIKPRAPYKFTIDGPWNLHFPPILGAPASLSLGTLKSWTDNTNPGVKYFSGSATYTATFTSPHRSGTASEQVYLDLGKVKNFAEVWVDGKQMPTLWKAPFRVPIGHLRAGRHALVVRVTNLWPNRMIGDEQFPAENAWKGDGSIAEMPEWALDMKPRPKSERITFATWRFFSKDSPLLESGLLGPVQVVYVPTVRR